MRKQQLEERRARNRALAIEDAKRRCGFCKTALPKTGAVQGWAEGVRYCSDGCRDDAALVSTRGMR